MPTPTTANRNYPLPHPDNELDTDVQRLVSALEAIDGDVASLLISVSQAALASHGHVIGDVTGLQAALNNKATAGHTHAINDLTDVDITGAPAGRPLTTQVGGGVGIGPAPMTQAQVDAAISAAIAALADAAPATLDTLNELAAALGDDPNFAATMTAALGGKLDASAAVVAATPDTVVKRDPSGDIYGRYLRGDYLRMHHAPSERISDTVFFSSDDEYIRKNTKEGVLASLGLTGVVPVTPLQDISVGAVGSLIAVRNNTVGSGWQHNVGTTVAGSVLEPSSTTGGPEGSGALSGTWTCLSMFNPSFRGGIAIRVA